MARPRTTAPSRRLAHYPFTPVSQYGVSKFLTSSKSNATVLVALLGCCVDYQNEQRCRISVTLFECPLDIISRFDDAHSNIKSSNSHAEPLATLCTTRRQHSPSAFCCHTSTEAVALSALPLVGLICTLHFEPPIKSLEEGGLARRFYVLDVYQVKLCCDLS